MAAADQEEKIGSKGVQRIKHPVFLSGAGHFLVLGSSKVGKKNQEAGGQGGWRFGDGGAGWEGE